MNITSRVQIAEDLLRAGIITTAEEYFKILSTTNELYIMKMRLKTKRKLKSKIP